MSDTVATPEAPPVLPLSPPEKPPLGPVPDLPQVVSVDGWKKNRFHLITLPSNTQVQIKVPDLPNLVRTGTIPNELVDIAANVASGAKVTKDDIVQQAEFYDKLVTLVVHSPAVTEEDVGDLPFEDKEMLVEIATRQRDLDAVGHQLAGLEKVKEFRTFRNLGPLFEDVEVA